MRASRNALARKLYTDEPIAAKAPRRRRRKGWVGLVIAGIGFISTLTLTTVVYLGVCTRMVEKQYALDHYESLLPALREENANLQIQVRALSKPSRIDRIARTELHMGVPTERIMIVQDDHQRPAHEYAWKGTLQKIGFP